MLVNTSFDILQINVSDNEIIAYLNNYQIYRNRKNFIMGLTNFPRQINQSKISLYLEFLPTNPCLLPSNTPQNLYFRLQINTHCVQRSFGSNAWGHQLSKICGIHFLLLIFSSQFLQCKSSPLVCSVICLLVAF